MEAIVELGALTPETAAPFGGKAAGLVRLLSVGARVPSAFAVRAGTALPGEWPEAQRRLLAERCAEMLRSGRLAVRSSALSEDGRETSYAGAFETVLGVGSVAEALAAVGHCIESGSGERVRARGIEGSCDVGVIVQHQVAARSAGVCFTVDPAGHDGAVLVEAVQGLGDALVSGHASPHRWRAYLSGLGTWEIHEDDTGDRDAPLAPSEVEEITSGAHALAERFGEPLDLEWAIDGDGRLWWLQARPVTVAAMPPSYQIDRAFDGVDDGPVSVWFNGNVRETLPDPLLPLTWSIWRDSILPMIFGDIFGASSRSPAFRHLPCLDLVHGRIAFNLNAVLGWPLAEQLMTSTMMQRVDPEGVELIESLRATGALQPRRLPGSRLRLLLDLLGAATVNGVRFLQSTRPRRAMQRMEALASALRRRCEERPLTKLEDEELIEEMQLLASPFCKRVRSALHYQAIAIAVYDIGHRLFRASPEAAGMLAVAIPDNPTTQMSVELGRLTEQAKPIADILDGSDDPQELEGRLAASPAGRVWWQSFQSFLDRYGHRGPQEFDLGAPRWSENPAMVLDLIRTGIRSTTEPIESRLSRLAEQRACTIDAAIARAPLWRRPILRRAARAVERFMPLREAPKHYAMMIFQRMRAAAHELGRRLAERGVIAAPEDVFFLELEELRAWITPSREQESRPNDEPEPLSTTGEGECPHEPAWGGGEATRTTPPGLRESLSNTVPRRKERFERFRREKPPDGYRSDGVPVPVWKPPVVVEDGALVGTAASPGRVTAPVRVLREPDPKQLRDGEVLVVRYADPGWTPLFPRAAAVVMEVGGVMCHAAVVAREMGIPAVFGVTDATTRLRDGQTVEVDGNAGTVRSQERSPSA